MSLDKSKRNKNEIPSVWLNIDPSKQNEKKSIITAFRSKEHLKNSKTAKSLKWSRNAVKCGTKTLGNRKFYVLLYYAGNLHHFSRQRDKAKNLFSLTSICIM